MPAMAPEGEFLRALFDAMKETGIRHAVMRNYESLPHSSAGSDIDLIVSPQDMDRARSVVLQAIERVGGQSIGLSELPGFLKVCALGRSRDGAWWGQTLDVNAGLRFRGTVLLDEWEALPLGTHEGIPVIATGFDALLGALKEALHNGYVPARYADGAAKIARSEWPRVERMLAPMGSRALARLRDVLLASGDPQRVRHECARLRRDLSRDALTRRAGMFLAGRGSYFWSKVRRYARPAGTVVAIIGTDGVGKSSVINALLPALAAATHDAIVVRHLRPTLLPPLARLRGRRAAPSGPVAQPHAAAPSGRAGSLFRLLYLLADYIAGYWLWTRPKIARQPAVVIFDRYAYDLLLDPRRFRISLSERTIHRLLALVPKPDLIICLHADPLRIAARKGELPGHEIERQVAQILRFAATQARARLVSTDGPLEQARDDVLVALLDCLRAKNGFHPREARRAPA